MAAFESGSDSTIFFQKSRLMQSLEGDHSKISGIAVHPITGDIYFADEILHKIFQIKGDRLIHIAGNGEEASSDGSLLSAGFFYIQGISFSPNGTFLAVADTDNYRIRLVDLEKGVVSTIATDFVYPYDVRFDSTGETVFVADTYAHQIKSVNLKDSSVTVIAGNSSCAWDLEVGPGLEVTLCYPYGIHFEENTNQLYVADSYNAAIRVIDISTGYLKTILRDEKLIPYPVGIVQKQNSLFVSEFLNSYIIEINLSSNSVHIFAGSDSSAGRFDGLAKDAQFTGPSWMTISNADILVSEYVSSSIRRISNSSNYVSTDLLPRGSAFEDGIKGLARFSSPRYLELDNTNGILYVSDYGNHAIRTIDLFNGFSVKTLTGQPYSGYQNGPLKTATFQYPMELLFNPKDRNILLVCDSLNKAIRKIDLKARFVGTLMDLGEVQPWSLAIDSFGDIYVGGKELRFYTNSSQGVILNTICSNGACKDGTIAESTTFMVSSLEIIGNDTVLFIDNYCNSIREYGPSSHTVKTLAGNGTCRLENGLYASVMFCYPADMIVNGSILIVSDQYGHAIRIMNTIDQDVYTLAGGPIWGYLNGQLTVSELNTPYGLKLDQSTDSLYFSDELIHAIRMLKDGKVTTIAGYGGEIDQFPQTRLHGAVFLNDSHFLVSDSLNNLLFLSSIHQSNVNELERFAGSGMCGLWDAVGSEAMFKMPMDMAISLSSGTVYIADKGSKAIRSINLKTRAVTTVEMMKFSAPEAIAIDPSKNILFVADSYAHQVWKFDIASKTRTLISGSVDGGAGYLDHNDAGLGLFAKPAGIAVDTLNEVLYVSDSYNHVIRKVNYNGGSVETLAGRNDQPGYYDSDLRNSRFYFPTKIIHDRRTGDSEILLILDSGNNAIRMIDLGASNIKVSTVFKDDSSKSIQSIALAPNGDLLVIRFQSLQLFPRIKSPAMKSGLGFDAMIGIAVGAIFIIGMISLILSMRRKSLMKKENNVSVLMAISNREPGVRSDATEGVTMSPSKSVAIALPGFLNLNLLQSIQMETAIKKGGTAQVCKGLLKDPILIEKYKAVEVAVKIFPESNDPELIASFNYEVAIMAAIPVSPYLVKLIGYSFKPRSIVMKYYGLNMIDCLKNPKFISNSEITLKAAIEIATGMNLLHQKDIVHFDLKPDNIMVDFRPQSNVMFFVVCDFGFSNFVADSDRQTVAGMRKPTSAGITPRYAAPELFEKIRITNCRFDSQLDKKIDVFAYGMTLYWLASGKKAWHEISNADEIEKLVVAGERPRFDAEEESHEEKKLIQSVSVQCCLQDPNDRPSFNDILSQLKQLQ